MNNGIDETCCCTLNYESEYYRLQEQYKKALDELERYKKALLNLCLKLD